MIHFLLCTLGSPDLVELVLRSIDRYAGECVVDLVKLPDETTSPLAHGQAIDFWRDRQKIGVRDNDIVIILDPDSVLLSDYFRVELDAAFSDPAIGIWGAGSAQDWGPRIHASMMAIRGCVFTTLQKSFAPCPDPREQAWRDTGGLYCMWAQAAGWALQPVERGPDWGGASAWWDGALVPLWAHLGGGTHSDVTRMTWKQRYLVPWRRREIRKRRIFIDAAQGHLLA